MRSARPNWNLWQSMATFGNHLATFGNSWELMATYANSWQLLATFQNLWQLLRTYGNFWQPLANVGNHWNHWKISVILDNYWPILATFQNSIIFGNQAFCGQFKISCRFLYPPVPALIYVVKSHFNSWKTPPFSKTEVSPMDLQNEFWSKNVTDGCTAPVHQHVFQLCFPRPFFHAS